MARDEELICRVGVGDQDALAELCRRYERPLFHFLARHTGGRDVEDLYQETWLRAVRAAPRFDPSRRFSTWVFQIAVNLCRDWHRRPPPEPVEADPNLPSTTDAPEARIDARRILAALPEAQRTVLLLRHYHGLSEEETAEILGCPRGTVKSRLHAARERLGQLMGSA
ncbi:MAG TPA: sigma-70 family RNA polymerase sigma factor [Candidatus Binatus sp.]|jgi:RNA polymerase sigma-70 factor, ECF subfamily|nr:sigma-70 family RNA polymerase sigma factor [Candidatus Binatus sp.]